MAAGHHGVAVRVARRAHETRMKGEKKGSKTLPKDKCYCLMSHYQILYVTYDSFPWPSVTLVSGIIIPSLCVQENSRAIERKTYAAETAWLYFLRCKAKAPNPSKASVAGSGVSITLSR